MRWKTVELQISSHKEISRKGSSLVRELQIQLEMLSFKLIANGGYGV